MNKNFRNGVVRRGLFAVLLAGSVLTAGLAACRSAPATVDEEKVRKDADRGMQDLRMEEERKER